MAQGSRCAGLVDGRPYPHPASVQAFPARLAAGLVACRRGYRPVMATSVRTLLLPGFRAVALLVTVAVLLSVPAAQVAVSALSA